MNEKRFLIVGGHNNGGSAEGAVRYDEAQTLTSEEKAQARDNIGAGTSDFSGSYDDLTDKPTIPTVNDPTINIYQGSTLKGSFTLNQSSGENINLDAGGGSQVQSDWDEADTTSPAYINNKPTIPAAPVQSDWNEADNTSLAFIVNKPSIPAAQVNSDWDAASGVSQILNKPTLATVATTGSYNDLTDKPTVTQEQADWNQTDTTAVDYIKNKPEIPSVPAMATQELTFTLEGGTTKTIEFYTVPNYFYVEDISGSNNTLTIKNASNTNPVEVFKSTDRTNWTSIGTTNSTGITATIPANGKLYLKAITNKWGDTTNTGANIITATGKHNVGGNIMSLLYGDNFQNQTTFPKNSSKNFGSLFNGNRKLVNANKLELTVTTLTQSCYHSMFKDCSSLTTAPVLPATTLANGCYVSMFMYCTSLTTAPVLPATVVTREGYSQIFKGCTSLNNITTYAQDISTYDCLYGWLSNVAATGDFYNLGNASYTEGASGIPSGWTEHTSL